MKKNKLLLAFLIALGFTSLHVKAQPCGPMSPSPDDCISCVSISLPPSVHLCSGSSYVFLPSVTIPPGYSVKSYNWTGTTVTPASGGPGAPPITTITPPAGPPCTTVTYPYTLSIDALAPNVVLNPNFSTLSPLDFCTHYYNTAPPLLNDTYYTICNNGNLTPGWGPTPPNFYDHTSGTAAGSMLIGQADPNVNIIWQQDVPVCPGQTYDFSFWHAWLHTSSTAPDFYVTIIDGAGVQTTSLFPSSTSSDIWENGTMNWVAPAPYTTATIVIHGGGPVPLPGSWGLMPFGTIFAIDDISFNRVCKAYGNMKISVEYSEVTGPTSVCTGQVIPLSGCIPGGTWGCTPASIATVDAFGNVTGVSPGIATVTYTTPSGCVINYPVTVNLQPVISGPTSICAGSTVPWTLVTGGTGNWSSSDTTIATVDASGNITGIAPGMVTITFSYPGGCKTTATITVNALPLHIPDVHICVGANTTLSTSPGGGTWVSLNPSIATVGFLSGLLTGASPGITQVVYTTSSGCTDTINVHVYNCAGGGGVAGRDLCMQESVQFTTAIGIPSGGTWSSSAPGIATVDPVTGVVTTVSPGVVTITYTVGSTTWSLTVTVHAMETACVVSSCCPYIFTFTSSCPSAVIHYTAYDFVGAPMGSGTTGPGVISYATMQSWYGIDLGYICIDSFTCGSCTWKGSCCASVNHLKPGATSVGENSITQQSIAIVPNPNNGSFRLKGNIQGMNGVKDIQLVVTDMLGKVIHTDIAQIHDGTLDKNIMLNNSIPNGIYYIRINGVNEQNVLRFVLAR